MQSNYPKGQYFKVFFDDADTHEIESFHFQIDREMTRQQVTELAQRKVEAWDKYAGWAPAFTYYHSGALHTTGIILQEVEAMNGYGLAVVKGTEYRLIMKDDLPEAKAKGWEPMDEELLHT